MSIKDKFGKVLDAAEKIERKITGDTLPDPKFMDVCEECDPQNRKELMEWYDNMR